MSKTNGYCGADLKALCAEAALISLRRAFPQVYQSNVRLALNNDALSITKGDFAAAINKVIPSSRREVGCPAKPLDLILLPLLEEKLDRAEDMLLSVFPSARSALRGGGHPLQASVSGDNESWYASIVDVQSESQGSQYRWDFSSVGCSARMLISGGRDVGQREVAGALLQRLEGFVCYMLDFPSLVSDLNAHSAEQALVHRVSAAYKNTPSVVYVPNIGNWWISASEGLRTLLISLIESVPSGLPVLWIATNIEFDDTPQTFHPMENHDSVEVSRDSEALDDERLRRIINWFGGRDQKTQGVGVHELVLAPPSRQAVELFFSSFFEDLCNLPSTVYSAKRTLLETDAVQLKPASDSLGHKAIEQANEQANEEREKNNLRELRNFFRTVLHVLYKEKRFSVFCKPVDPEAVPDYYDIIKYPMDLETIRMKIDEGCYTTYFAFLRDIERIVFNAREYNPLVGKDSRGKNIVHAAHSMLDHVESHAYSFKRQLGYDLFKRCESIARRKGLQVPSRCDFHPDALITDQDLRYYKVILDKHEQLKIEMGAEHPSFAGCKDNQGDDSATGEPNEIINISHVETRRSSLRRRGEQCLSSLNLSASPPKVKRVRTAMRAVESTPSIILEDNTVQSSNAITAVDGQSSYDEVEPQVELSVGIDLDAHPELLKLRQSIEAAAQVNFRFLTLNIIESCIGTAEKSYRELPRSNH